MKHLKTKVFFILTGLLFFINQPFISAQTIDIALLHWNDFHSFNEYKITSTGDTVGGYTYLAAYRDSLAALHPGRAFSLHAGDDFQGTPISTFTRGASQIRILNQIHPDAFVLGNHEFDYGRGNLDSLIRSANFPMISGNIFDHRTHRLFTDPTTILHGDDVQIGVIGVTAPNLYALSLPANVADLEILDPVKVVRNYACDLEPDVDLTVVLSHMGLYQDSLLAASLGEKSPVDLIIGGHSHTSLFDPEIVNGIPIVQAGDHGRFLGRSLVSVDTATKSIRHLDYRLVPIQRNREPRVDVQSLVDSLQSRARESLNHTIATLKTPWERKHHGESNIGDWQADVMRQYADADIAFQNSGGIRKDLAAGPVKVKDIWEITPFGNHFVRFTVTGNQLDTILRHQIRDSKEFLQISGLEYTWNKSEQQFTRAQVGGKTIQHEKTYTIVTNNYVFSHFEAFFGIPGDIIKNVNHFPDLDRDVFLQAAREQKTIHSKNHHRTKVVE